MTLIVFKNNITSINVHHLYKERKLPLCVSNCFSWATIYIARDCTICISNTLSIFRSWERIVHCILCNSMATLKPTKTRRIMLRCNTCGVLLFANGMLAQEQIKRLVVDYRFKIH